MLKNYVTIYLRNLRKQKAYSIINISGLAVGLSVFILVLAVFVWLVTRHHTKLYAPADFRRDEGFLSAIDPSKVRLQITRGGASNSDIDQLIHELDEVKKTVNALSGDGPRAAQAAVNHP